MDRCRNIDLLAIDYAVGPHLRSRLTLGGRAWPRKPEVFGERDSHPLYRYSCLHLHFHALQPSLSVDLHCPWKAPLPLLTESAASVFCLAPLYFRRRFTGPVSYYALFQGWLLLSQPPGCLRAPTSFPTEQNLGTLADGLGCFPFDYGRYHPQSVSRRYSHGIRSLTGVGRRVSPLAQSVLYLRGTHTEAIPKYVSGRTSYLQV
jgi:hypothetical protein